jgi:D-alanyl-D-alanine-carboxypeptidase/D-alanyl-D-alanine-endopeptidase
MHTFKRIYRLQIIWLVILSFSATAQIPDAVKQEIDLRIKHDINPSIVMGVYENGQFHFYTKGMQNKALAIPASKNSVYEIGSITKTFTGLLLAHEVVAGKIKPDSPIQDYWPAPFQLIDNNQAAITFKQLATHSSGLPRIPANLSAFSNDPYAAYDRQQLLAGVKMAAPKNAGNQYAYSNFGAGLLGESIAVIENDSYNHLITKKILQPLNLVETYMQLNDVPSNQLAQGYRGSKEAQPWQFKALAGAGSIRSSIKDLLNYGVAYLKQPAGSMKDAMALATQVHYLENKLQVGLGWHINTKGIIWHNGATAGFSSMIMIDPKQQKVVAGITNHNNSVDDLVIHLMNPEQPFKSNDYPVEISAEQTKIYLGTFKQNKTGQTIEIKLMNNRLFLVSPKQPKYALTYIGKDTFKLNLVSAKVKFIKNEKDEVNGFELHGWGQPQQYIRSSADDMVIH